MPLSPVPNRVPKHLRDVRYRSFEREDGLWDVEGELVDTKAYDLVLSGERKRKAGEPIHHMWIRCTIDTTLTVVAIEVAMDAHPLGECPLALPAMQKMVGCCMARGWRKAIEANLGNIEGCTHMRELLFNMATAAFQSVNQAFARPQSDQPPRHLGQCKGWDFNGAGVAAIYPQFIGWQAPKPGGTGAAAVATTSESPADKPTTDSANKG
ncbi:DUF2889 domain-containing protein [Comamonas sp. MYb21]|uniref:DUF2889 domain-containing protein n=1 Tax=Comamonas sp. MYb21 TaxID=1848648 RepID=UPI00309B8518